MPGEMRPRRSKIASTQRATPTRPRRSSPDAIVWQYELISSGGSLGFTLGESGSISGETEYPDLTGNKPMVDVTGTFTVNESSSVSSGVVTFAFSEGPYGTMSGTLTRSSGELFFTSTEGAFFDFNRDGTPEAATLEVWFDLN